MTSHGFKPEDAIIELAPRPGEFTLREEDILATIAEQSSSIALVLFSGVQYYTGQWFPMEKITKAAQAQVRFIYRIFFETYNQNTFYLSS